MTDIIWPVDLPQTVDQDGYKEARLPNAVRSQVDQGRPKARRRYTASIKSFTVSLLLDEDQTEILDEFYDDTTAAGSLEFDWVDPRTNEAAVVQFWGDPPAIATAGGTLYKATFQMIILP
jgi:hypothetical protein